MYERKQFFGRHRPPVLEDRPPKGQRTVFFQDMANLWGLKAHGKLVRRKTGMRFQNIWKVESHGLSYQLSIKDWQCLPGAPPKYAPGPPSGAVVLFLGSSRLAFPEKQYASHQWLPRNKTCSRRLLISYFSYPWPGGERSLILSFFLLHTAMGPSGDRKSRKKSNKQ